MIRRALFVVVTSLLGVIVGVLATLYTQAVLERTREKGLFAELRFAYRTCEEYYAEHGKAPEDTASLLNYAASKGHTKGSMGALENGRILYWPVSSDRWELIAIWPQTRIVLVRRILAEGAYKYQAIIREKDRLRYDVFEEEQGGSVVVQPLSRRMR